MAIAPPAKRRKENSASEVCPSVCSLCGQKLKSSPISEKSPKGSSRNYENPKKETLEDYLKRPEPRLVTQFGSAEFYPTDEVRAIIQGMVTSVLNLKYDGSKNGHLWHPKNFILGQKRCMNTYSKYVSNLSSGDVPQNRKLLQKADEQFPESIEVILGENINDFKCDDFEALRHMVFDVILSINGKKPLLSSEWEDFSDLFSRSKPDYALISSHSCLWGFRKRLNLYRQLDDWCNPYKAKDNTRNLVVQALWSMPILKTNWVNKLKKDRHLARFATNISFSRQQTVYGFIRIFRNLVEHCQDTASALSPYRDGRYLDYKLRKLFPNLLEVINSRLLHTGFIY